MTSNPRQITSGFFLSLFYLTIYPNPPCQLPCGRNPEKTHDFQQSVDQLLPRMIKCSNTGFELLTSEVGGSRSDDKATEALNLWNVSFYVPPTF